MRDHHQPRVIRKVIRKGRDGRPKIARDLRLGITIERVMAQAPKRCAYHKCQHVFDSERQGGWIATGTEYAKVTRLNRQQRIGTRYFPTPDTYHFGCVPPEAWPLLRFFKFPETPTDKTT